jgi:iron complex outermembrane receptor protein
VLSSFVLTAGVCAGALAQAPPRESNVAASGNSGGCSAGSARDVQRLRTGAAKPANGGSAPSPSPQSKASPVPQAQTESDRPAVSGSTGGVVTTTSITSDALQSSSSQSTYDALKHVPGVAPADPRGGATADALQIRGIKLSATTSYRLDGGLPIVNTIALPIEDKCRIEALKGAGALEFGVASPAGIVNYVLKRAGTVPATSLTITGNGYGQAFEALDVGRRFGGAKQFGVRVNLATGEYGSFVKGAGGTRYLETVTADWNASARAGFQLDYEQFGVDTIEQSALLELKAVKGVIPLPRIPDPTRLLSGAWARSVGTGRNVALRGAYDLGGGWSASAEWGRSDVRRPERNLSLIGNYDVTTGQGKETVMFVRDQRMVNMYENLAVKQRTERGAFSNEITLGVNRNERDFNNPQNKSVVLNQNIFDPVRLAAPAPPAGAITYLPNDSRDVGYYVQDALRLFDRLRVFGGVRRIGYVSESHVTGTAVDRSTTSFLAPAAGVVYDASRSVAVYASYLKSLEETGQAPVTSANAFHVLPPAPATQREVGIRATARRASATLGYFTIDKGNATIDPVTNVYAVNGTVAFAGLESTLSVTVSPRLTVNAGGQIMRAAQRSQRDPSIDGKLPENTPNVSDNVGIVYRPSFAKDLTLNTGMLFIGRRQLNPQNQGTIPGVYTNTFGANWVTRVNEHRLAFNLNCTNLFDKRYYSAAVNGALGIGNPRTVTLSTRLDL